ncbi:hypothetical protein FQR65_LT13040 [Abscondita terminalis]|nr:hypothetical protein FQR65_LT13040 [Abscondita terminalis]
MLINSFQFLVPSFSGAICNRFCVISLTIMEWLKLRLVFVLTVLTTLAACNQVSDDNSRISNLSSLSHDYLSPRQYRPQNNLTISRYTPSSTYSSPNYPLPPHNVRFSNSRPSPTYNTAPQPPVNRFKNVYHQTNTHQDGTARTGGLHLKLGIEFDNARRPQGTRNYPHHNGFNHRSYPAQPGYPFNNHYNPPPVHQSYNPKTYATGNNYMNHGRSPYPQYSPYQFTSVTNVQHIPAPQFGYKPPVYYG